MTSSPDTVSVVIPAYNCGAYILEAVESALAQDPPPLEVIVVDDGSTDDTVGRLRPVADRIRYIHQENRGVGAARNTGILASHGNWIALLDADDYWYPDKTSVQLDAVAGDESIGLVGSPEYRDRRGPLQAHLGVREVTIADLLTSTPVGPSSVLVRRECFETVGLFDETLGSVEDRDMWLRLIARYRALQVNAPCWWYRTHASQMSRKAQRMFDNYKRVLLKLFAQHPEYHAYRRLAFAHLHLDATHSFYEEGNRGAALRHLFTSWWFSPFSLQVRDNPDWLLRQKLLVKFAFGIGGQPAAQSRPGGKSDRKAKRRA